MHSKTRSNFSVRFQILARLLAISSLVWLPEASAQLYKKIAPPGSTFVRLFNGTTTAGISGRIADKPQPSLPPFTAGGYVFMPPGTLPVQIEGREQSYPFEADHFYTVAQTATGQKLFDLKGFDSQLKAMVIVYNLLPDATLSLKTADGKTAVFENVESYKSAQREINPLTVTLALFMGERKIADVPAVTFSRGKASSLMVGGTAAVPVVRWDELE